MDLREKISLAPKKVQTKVDNDPRKLHKSFSDQNSKMPNADAQNQSVSPLKRKSQNEVTSLEFDSKRKRHHRRNKRRRHRSGGQPGRNKMSSGVTLNVKLPRVKSQGKAETPKKVSGGKPGGESTKPPPGKTHPILWSRKRRFILNQNPGYQNAAGIHTVRGPGGKSRIVLRPTKVPLLNAPKNSTQFIIEDHGSSDLVWNFKPNDAASKGSSLTEAQITGSVIIEGLNEGSDSNPILRRISSDGEFTPRAEEEDTFFMEYSERDFQSVYETAHQEEIAEWDRKKLVEEIGTLERRHKELVKVLARIDPHIYVDRLQRQLGRLQEQNVFLKSVTKEEFDSPDEIDLVPGVRPLLQEELETNVSNESDEVVEKINESGDNSGVDSKLKQFGNVDEKSDFSPTDGKPTSLTPSSVVAFDRPEEVQTVSMEDPVAALDSCNGKVDAVDLAHPDPIPILASSNANPVDSNPKEGLAQPDPIAGLDSCNAEVKVNALDSNPKEAVAHPDPISILVSSEAEVNTVDTNPKEAVAHPIPILGSSNAEAEANSVDSDPKDPIAILDSCNAEDEACAVDYNPKEVPQSDPAAVEMDSNPREEMTSPKRDFKSDKCLKVETSKDERRDETATVEKSEDSQGAALSPDSTNE